MQFSPRCHELWSTISRQRSNCTVSIPRLDLIYHEHMWLHRKKMKIIHNIAPINIVDSKEHKISQEQWLRNDNWKYDISVFSKVVKNKLEAIPIPIQDDFFYWPCLPLLRSNPTQQSLGVPFEEAVRQVVLFASDIKAYHFCHVDICLWSSDWLSKQVEVLLSLNCKEAQCKKWSVEVTYQYVSGFLFLIAKHVVSDVFSLLLVFDSEDQRMEA